MPALCTSGAYVRSRAGEPGGLEDHPALLPREQYSSLERHGDWLSFALSVAEPRIIEERIVEVGQ